MSDVFDITNILETLYASDTNSDMLDTFLRGKNYICDVLDLFNMFDMSMICQWCA